MTWLEDTITHLVLDSPENRLIDFRGQPIFDSPLVGVACGDDPLFELFRKVVSARHLQPQEFLNRYAPEDADLAHVNVIVWVLPFAKEVRCPNRVSFTVELHESTVNI